MNQHTLQNARRRNRGAGSSPVPRNGSANGRARHRGLVVAGPRDRRSQGQSQMSGESAGGCCRRRGREPNLSGAASESGAPSLPRYRLAEKSKSVGDQCPICSANMAVGDEVIVCPTCHRANHRECWEENLFHCGNFTCEAWAWSNAAAPCKSRQRRRPRPRFASSSPKYPRKPPGPAARPRKRGS